MSGLVVAWPAALGWPAAGGLAAQFPRLPSPFEHLWTRLGLVLLALPVVVFGYAYFVYPAVLKLLSMMRPPAPAPEVPNEHWPTITIAIPCYNEEASIGATIETLLAADYPADRRQILIISDCSSDRTDEVVLSYAARGVELLRLPQRSGKTAAENAAYPLMRGEIIVNMDATIRLKPHSLRALVREFRDPTIGVASGHDVAPDAEGAEAPSGETGYVGYEMWVRSMETQLGSIVGASGCFYGMRRDLFDAGLPSGLARDFDSAMVAREHGLRAVSVNEAECIVPQTTSLNSEFRRKERTMAHGLATLWHRKHLLNPFRYGGFALMLISHKLFRWLPYLLLPLALVGLFLLSFASPVAAVLLGLAAVAWVLYKISVTRERSLPSVLAIPAFMVAAALAGVKAWGKLFRRQEIAAWEPTRRPAAKAGDGEEKKKGDPDPDPDAKRRGGAGSGGDEGGGDGGGGDAGKGNRVARSVRDRATRESVTPEP